MADSLHRQYLLFGIFQIDREVLPQLLSVQQVTREYMSQLHLVKVDAIEVLVHEELLRKFSEGLWTSFEVLKLKYTAATVRQFELLQEFLLQIRE